MLGDCEICKYIHITDVKLTQAKKHASSQSVFCCWVFKNGLVMHYIYNKTSLSLLFFSSLSVSLLSLNFLSLVPSPPPPGNIFTNHFLSAESTRSEDGVFTSHLLPPRTLSFCLPDFTYTHTHTMNNSSWVRQCDFVCFCATCEEWLCVYHRALVVLTLLLALQLWQLSCSIEFPRTVLTSRQSNSNTFFLKYPPL